MIIIFKLKIKFKNLKQFDFLIAHILHIQAIYVSHQFPLAFWKIISQTPNINNIMDLNCYDCKFNLNIHSIIVWI